MLCKLIIVLLRPSLGVSQSQCSKSTWQDYWPGKRTQNKSSCECRTNLTGLSEMISHFPQPCFYLFMEFSCTKSNLLQHLQPSFSTSKITAQSASDRGGIPVTCIPLTTENAMIKEIGGYKSLAFLRYRRIGIKP